MTFHALLVSKDEEAAAVLTPLLSRCGVTVACCGYPEALCRLTEEKFDSVIVDFDDPHSASLVLQNASQVTSGVKAVTVALLSDKTKVRNVFGAGANFILYKPISVEQAEASLRAATALIKRERRRSFRVPVQVPIQLQVENGTPLEGILLDLSEDGMDVLAAQPLCPGARISAQFNLPDGNTEIQGSGEIAWASPNGQAGVRFIDLPDNLRATLKTWVAANAPEIPPPDPEPVSPSQEPGRTPPAIIRACRLRPVCIRAATSRAAGRPRRARAEAPRPFAPSPRARSVDHGPGKTPPKWTWA